MVPSRNFLNATERFIPDALRGLVAAAADLRWNSEHGYLIRDSPLRPGHVAIVSGGGSGHEPLHAGFIGRGMLTAACPGLIFTSPNALQIAGATIAADAGGGVLHVVKNYTGDVMNFSIARQIAEESSVRTDVVLVDDDIATEVADSERPGRRGTAATVVVEKLCGAAAERGDDLATVAAVGRRVAAAARSMAVALAPCTVPGASVPSFDLPAGQMEIGIGIHGERGVDRAPVAAASDIVAALLARILPAAQVRDGDEVIVVVNGLGATHSLELNLLFGEVAAQLAAAGIQIARSLVGSFVTALDMAGVSVTVVRADPEMLELWDAPTTAPAWPVVTGPPVGELTDGAIVEPDDRADGGPENPWLSAFVGRVRESVGALTELDRRAGDGDFGTNMAAALRHYALPLRGTDAEVLLALSTSYFVRAGGTSGAVFGTFFRALYAGLGDERWSTELVARAVRQALDQIQALGGARVGDKTVVDAVSPAADALDDAARRDIPLAVALQSAADAAAAGVQATKDSRAARGRASYVGDAARGVEDPGALVMSWFFEAAAGR
ncbi:dihydroxyacetone kinase [Mycobacteroides franklinii]|uniref:Dihydroxyacetone kinase n=1 Tax=Mycobacteroides franklinii TaxID=948102 RepID=A0A1S1L5L6_9MYCO|nr:dihydroxyacetone kinase family protein [Mycobacteroides franklinii]OHU21041.1 dihydroxyacetone kinase [Mycobacteroides franklinii]